MLGMEPTRVPTVDELNAVLGVARASGLYAGIAGAALQALAEHDRIERTEALGGPVYGMWF